MPLSVLLIIIVVLVGLVGITLWWSSQEKRARARTRETARNLPRNPSLFDLAIGDIVQYIGQDWVVEGKLVYTEHGFSWQEYMLQDRDEIRWLSVEEDDWVTVTLTAPVTDLDVSSTPPRELTYAGVVYKCKETGQAQMRREGNPRRPDSEACHYYDYEGPDKRVLSVENWDGDIEVSAGTIIAPRSLTLLPGEGSSVYR